MMEIICAVGGIDTSTDRHRHALWRDGRRLKEADPLRHQNALEGPRRHDQIGLHRRRRLQRPRLVHQVVRVNLKVPEP